MRLQIRLSFLLFYSGVALFCGALYSAESLLLLQEQLHRLSAIAAPSAEWTLLFDRTQSTPKDAFIKTELIRCHPTDPSLLGMAYLKDAKATLKIFIIPKSTIRMEYSTNIKELTALMWNGASTDLLLFIEEVVPAFLLPLDKSFFEDHYATYDKDFIMGGVDGLFVKWQTNPSLLSTTQQITCSFIETLYRTYNSQKKILMSRDPAPRDLEHFVYYDISWQDFQDAANFALSRVKAELERSNYFVQKDALLDLSTFMPCLSVAYVSPTVNFFYYSTPLKQEKHYLLGSPISDTVTILPQDKLEFGHDTTLIIWRDAQKIIESRSYNHEGSSFLLRKELYNEKSFRDKLNLSSPTDYTVTALATAGNAPFFVMLVEVQERFSHGPTAFILVEINQLTSDLIVIPLPPDKKIKKELLAFNADGSMVFIATEEGQLLYHQRIRA